MLKTILLLTLALGAVVPAAAQKPYSISSEYDKFKDRTLVYSDYMRVYGSDWNSNPLDLSVQFSYPGRTATAPRGVLFYFWSATPKWRFTELPTALLAIADQERLALGEAHEIERKIHADRYSVSAREYVPIIVPFDLFRKLARSNSVEMQLGNIEFRLNDRHMETLRAIASRMASQ